MEGNIAIDGPAGAGKSTVAKELAKKLGYVYIDTGAMYRAVTWKALREGIDVDDETALTKLAEETNIVITNDNSQQRIICDENDVTEAIREPEVSNNVSLVAKVPGVRKRLQILQRNLAKSNKVVMDGRDIATSVLPDAPYKFYLTASLEKRAFRRYNELMNKGFKTDIDKIKTEIAKRDRMDKKRSISPLVKAPDAIEIDTSDLTPQEVLKEIIKYLER